MSTKPRAMRPLWMYWRWWLWCYPSAAGGWYIHCCGHGFHVERVR